MSRSSRSARGCSGVSTRPLRSDKLRCRWLAACRQRGSLCARRWPLGWARSAIRISSVSMNLLRMRLLDGGEGLFGLEGREHTAQVEQERREWREWRFRWSRRRPGETCREKDDAAAGRRAGRVPARSVLLANDGTWRRYFRAECCLLAERPADASQLCSALRTCRPLGPGCSGGLPIAQHRARTINIISHSRRRW